VDDEVLGVVQDDAPLGSVVEVDELSATGVSPFGALAFAVGLLGAGSLLARHRREEDAEA
jgi:hypothetical protein